MKIDKKYFKHVIEKLEAIPGELAEKIAAESNPEKVHALLMAAFRDALGHPAGDGKTGHGK